jgi:hypothetical protein
MDACQVRNAHYLFRNTTDSINSVELCAALWADFCRLSGVKPPQNQQALASDERAQQV